MAKLTLRLRDDRTAELLTVVAKRYGLSKNELIEQLLERELQAAAMVIEQDLSSTIEQLRSYRAADDRAAAIEAVARAEGSEEDPMQARRAAAPGEDAYGIMDAFA
jgi:hypothetical protein